MFQVNLCDVPRTWFASAQRAFRAPRECATCCLFVLGRGVWENIIISRPLIDLRFSIAGRPCENNCRRIALETIYPGRGDKYDVGKKRTSTERFLWEINRTLCGRRQAERSTGWGCKPTTWKPSPPEMMCHVYRPLTSKKPKPPGEFSWSSSGRLVPRVIRPLPSPDYLP